jgi:hypothetical protein
MSGTLTDRLRDESSYLCDEAADAIEELSGAAEGAAQWLELLIQRFGSEWPGTAAHHQTQIDTIRAAIAKASGPARADPLFVTCPECNGSGEPYDGVRCTECDGAGRVETDGEPITLEDLDAGAAMKNRYSP